MPTDMEQRASSERGVTSVELLSSILILTVVVAVVTPLVNRFAESGSEEARLTEFHDVSTAVVLLMSHNEAFSIPHPVTRNTPPCRVGTKLLSEFPDVTSDNGLGGGNDGGKESGIYGDPYIFTGPVENQDLQGFVLYDHDAIGGDGPAKLFNYLYPLNATYCYRVDSDGTVHQYLEDGIEQTR